MTVESTLEQAFKAYLDVLRLKLFANRKEQLRGVPFALDSKRSEILTLVQNVELESEFVALLKETQAAFPTPIDELCLRSSPMSPIGFPSKEGGDLI